LIDESRRSFFGSFHTLLYHRSRHLTPIASVDGREKMTKKGDGARQHRKVPARRGKINRRCDIASSLVELIGSIYDCALDPSRWDQTLSDIADVFDGSPLLLSLIDRRHHRFLFHKSVGLKPDEIEGQPKYLSEINAALGDALASWPSLDEPHVESRHTSPAYIRTSPYFQEWVKPTGMVDFMKFFLMHTPTRLSLLSVGRNERQGIITEREIELGKLLLPHLRRAVTISNVLDVRTIEGRRMAETLDALSCAVLLANEHGTILHTNRAAEPMLDKGGPFQSAQGVLQATAPSAAAELRSALALATSNEAGIGKGKLAIRLTGPDVPPIFAHVLPLTGSDFRTRLQPAAVAAVLIGAPPDAQDGADALAAAFGLTPAETRLLANLFGGRTLNETAAALGITRPTAKTHLEHIFLKTGVTRQAELVRLWTGLISPTGSNM
jgi:DNA-binding CsgD family transcriptional regulator/PAS domain-containing protein